MFFQREEAFKNWIQLDFDYFSIFGENQSTRRILSWNFHLVFCWNLFWKFTNIWEVCNLCVKLLENVLEDGCVGKKIWSWCGIGAYSSPILVISKRPHPVPTSSSLISSVWLTIVAPVALQFHKTMNIKNYQTRLSISRTKLIQRMQMHLCGMNVSSSFPKGSSLWKIPFIFAGIPDSGVPVLLSWLLKCIQCLEEQISVVSGQTGQTRPGRPCSGHPIGISNVIHCTTGNQ